MAVSCSLLLAAASSIQAQGRFDLNGSISGADGKTIFLYYQTDGNLVVQDSTKVTDGRFSFAGDIARPTMAVLFIGQPSYDNKANSQIYLEPASMTVAGLQADDFTNGVFTGSKTQSEVDALNKEQMPLINRLRELQVQSQSATPDQAAALAEEMQSLASAVEETSLKFVKSHPDSYHTPYLLRFMTSRIPFSELKEIYDSLTPEVRDQAKEVGAQIAAMQTTQPGMPAPNLAGINPDGKEIKLSDLKGKVVLIDFWATWCKPCRAGLPHVKSLFDKYHDKGLEVFCVADNDNQVDLWKQVMEKEGMTRYHNILRGLKMDESTGQFDRSNDQNEKYAVTSIPAKFLVDREGKIIFKVESDEQLDAKLAEIFN